MDVAGARVPASVLSWVLGLALSICLSLPVFAASLTRVTPVGVTTSATKSNAPPSSAIDGELGTWWTGSDPGAALTIDLGVPKHVKELRIAFYYGDTRVYNFEVQSSTDGRGYTTAGSFQSSGAATGFETFGVTAPGRYLRIVGSGNSINRYNSYREIQVFAEATLTQLKPVKVIASEESKDSTPLAAIDGNLNTEWSIVGVGSHLTLDLGAPKPIKQVLISFYNGNARVYGLQVQVSTDGQHFTSAGSFQSSGTTSTFESFSVDATARYLRIMGWGNNINRSNAYNEVQVYGIR